MFFEMKDLGLASNYIFLQINQNIEEGHTELDQTMYLNQVLEKFGMNQCKPVGTPLDPNFDFNILKNAGLKDPKYVKLCRQIIVSLMYVVLGTRPDLCFTVTMLSRFLEQGSENLYVSLKRVLRYIKGTVTMKL